jgi:glycosyl transferase family 25
MPIKAYVTNLERRPDRAQRMVQLLADRGIPCEIVVALDHADPEVAPEVERRSRIPGGVRSRGAIACGMTHEAVWRRIAEGEEPHAIVFEDDVIIADDFAAALADPAIVPADADIVKMETFFKRQTRVDRKPASAIGRYRLHRLRGHSMGTAAYLLTQKGARALLSRPLPPRVVDWILFDEIEGLLNDLTVYQMVPAPCAQGSVLAQKRGWPSDPVFASDVKPQVMEGDRATRKPRLPFTTPDDRKRYLTHRLGLSRKTQLIERRMRTAVCRAIWAMRGQTLGEVPFVLDGPGTQTRPPRGQ